MFGAIISPIEVAWGPVETELALDVAAAEPVEAHVHELFCLGTMVLLVTSTVVELSVWRGDLVYG